MHSPNCKARHMRFHSQKFNVFVSDASPSVGRKGRLNNIRNELTLFWACFPTPPHPASPMEQKARNELCMLKGRRRQWHTPPVLWEIPWTEDPGRLQSMGSLRVRHDWATSLSLFTFMRWRRKWQPSPVFLPGESQGQRSLVGCRLWGRTESDTTEAT